MADPLRKDAFRSVTIAEELDETRGRVSRTDLNMDMASPDRQLPEAGNPRLNRAAEQVGGADRRCQHERDAKWCRKRAAFLIRPGKNSTSSEIGQSKRKTPSLIVSPVRRLRWPIQLSSEPAAWLGQLRRKLAI